MLYRRGWQLDVDALRGCPPCARAWPRIFKFVVVYYENLGLLRAFGARFGQLVWTTFFISTVDMSVEVKKKTRGCVFLQEHLEWADKTFAKDIQDNNATLHMRYTGQNARGYSRLRSPPQISIASSSVPCGTPWAKKVTPWLGTSTATSWTTPRCGS
jgi:hypothetical protein